MSVLGNVSLLVSNMYSGLVIFLFVWFSSIKLFHVELFYFTYAFVYISI